MRILLCIALLGCNQIYGLDETGPVPPNADGDDHPDADDNCPDTPNDQTNSDGDGFGDACDFCPEVSTAFNDDADGDLFGDDCDVCPIEPDFQDDDDGDGVGDECAPFMTSRRVLFDGFSELAPAWTTLTVPWELRPGDTISPTAPLDALDPGLHRLDAMVTAPSFQIELSVVARRPWAAPDRFGIGLVGADGSAVARCEVVCATRCEVIIEHAAANASYPLTDSLPVAKMVFRREQTSSIPGNHIITCGFEPAPRFTLDVPETVLDGSPTLWGSPETQLDYVHVVEGVD